MSFLDRLFAAFVFGLSGGWAILPLGPRLAQTGLPVWGASLCLIGLLYLGLGAVLIAPTARRAWARSLFITGLLLVGVPRGLPDIGPPLGLVALTVGAWLALPRHRSRRKNALGPSDGSSS
ncbi:hypothetical protein EKE94_17510 [Mesobaculum littorinae]|uniref:Uncharacterized protein n=1 Tax=Mesobaculum littorinae TaxID=2486419 RepID=A0A438ADC7_9RHOB|nr:hypothetical protein [Mesobaculum littorinae]RVV96677.1 hypothetical protein EKE94_17510 [Mesobaculum littorinae]